MKIEKEYLHFIFCTCGTQHESKDWVKKIGQSQKLKMAQLFQFPCNQADFLAKSNTHEVVSLAKFHLD